jgi:DNA-binding Lrp family transcriptional regulator
MDEFIKKVAEMRRLQKLYFRSNHDKFILMECKKAESEVDEFLNVGQLPEKKQVADAVQPSLFQ